MTTNSVFALIRHNVGTRRDHEIKSKARWYLSFYLALRVTCKRTGWAFAASAPPVNVQAALSVLDAAQFRNSPECNQKE